MPGVYVGALWYHQAIEAILWCFAKWTRSLLGSHDAQWWRKTSNLCFLFFITSRVKLCSNRAGCICHSICSSKVPPIFLWRDFTLVIDHRPLCKILGEKEGIPPLAAARMQRWVDECCCSVHINIRYSTFQLHKTILLIVCHGYQVCHRSVIVQRKFTP